MANMLCLRLSGSFNSCTSISSPTIASRCQLISCELEAKYCSMPFTESILFSIRFSFSDNSSLKTGHQPIIRASAKWHAPRILWVLFSLKSQSCPNAILRHLICLVHSTEPEVQGSVISYFRCSLIQSDAGLKYVYHYRRSAGAAWLKVHWSW